MDHRRPRRDVELAGPDDREALAELGRSQRFGPLRGYAHHVGDHTGAEGARHLVAALDDPAAEVLVARAGDRLVGALALTASSWEGEQLGTRVARTAGAVVAPDQDGAALAAALFAGAGERWREGGGGLLISRVDAADAGSLVGAQDAGLRVLEDRVTYLGDHDAPPEHHHRHRGFRVERHTAQEVAAIPGSSLAVLRRWVAGTDRPGHFYSDHRLAKARVDALYVAWLEKTFAGGWGDVVYTAWVDDSVVGFLAWLEAPDLAERYGIRTLVAGLGAAAAPEGRGALGDMYEAVCTDRPLGTRFVEHTSQAGNSAVLATWAKFHAIRPGWAEYVLHGWFDA